MYNECVTRSIITTTDDTPISKIFHPLLALIASATDNELAKYVEYLKHENKILRARLPKQIHTTYEERQTLLKFGKAIGRAIEELATIVSPATFYRWVGNPQGMSGGGVWQGTQQDGELWSPEGLRLVGIQSSWYAPGKYIRAVQIIHWLKLVHSNLPELRDTIESHFSDVDFEG